MRVTPEQAYKAFKRHGSKRAAAHALDIPRTTFRRLLRRHEAVKEDPPGDVVKTKFEEKTGEILTLSTRIKTVEEALEKGEVDTDRWEVKTFILNSWEVGAKGPDNRICVHPLWQVKVWLQRKVEDPFHKALEDLTEEIARTGIQPPPILHSTPQDPHMLEVSLFDTHFGKLAWAPETGENYDLKIAEKRYYEAVADLLQKSSGFGIEKILVPIGQDFLHINALDNKTQRGTPQDVDSRLPKIFFVACRAIINVVERCRQIAPTKIVWVPGNHDPETSFYLACYIQAWYRNAIDVVVDVSPTYRKYERYGISLLGFTHGGEEKMNDLPLIMARENKKEWAECEQFEWHIGHHHKVKETRYNAADTFGPVRVRTMPSLAGTDSWHYRKGYVKNLKAAEAYLWNKEKGYVGHFSTNVDSQND